MNADGEPVYDPLKDFELATAKVGPVALAFLSWVAFAHML